MVETTKKLVTGSDSDTREIVYHLWPLKQVRKDLIKQGGLEDSLLRLPFRDKKRRKNPGKYEIVDNYFTDHSTYLAIYDGKYNGIRFRMRWKKTDSDSFLVVRMEELSPQLVNAFSRVLESSSFTYDCDKSFQGEFTFTWYKKTEER